MKLDNNDLTRLLAYFKASDHEFFNNYAYIREGAIATRLEEIDPEWQLEVIDIEQRDKQVFAHVRLMVKGVVRDGVGMQKITYNKAGDSEVGEPEKSAVTDAFKRAARLFGIGRYLLDCPSRINDEAKMQKWLDNPTTEDARKALGTSNGQRVDTGNESQATGEGIPAHLVKLVAIKPASKGGNQYVFHTKSGNTINAFASEPFVQAGYIADKQEWIDGLAAELGKPLVFDVPIAVTLMKKNEFWNIVEVLPFNVDF